MPFTEPAADEHIAPCGLFCSNCRRFDKGRCQGCQVQAGFSRCAVRKCCAEKDLETCAACPSFQDGRDFRECPKVNNWISRAIGAFTGSDRPAALAVLRDRGREAYLSLHRASGKM